MATVYLPSEMKERTGGLDVVVIDAPRVHELRLELVRRYPGLGGDLLEQMAVAIDGEIHNDADYLALSSNSEIHFVPRIAGGQVAKNCEIKIRLCHFGPHV
jgi:molybdopterin converting factor small subunit